MLRKEIKNFGAILFLSITSSFAMGQGAGKKDPVITLSPETQASIVRKAFQSEVQETLAKFLKPHQYNVDVGFKLGTSLKSDGDIPYAPDNIVPDAFQGLPTGKQFDQIQDLKITIQVPKWVDEGTKKTLKSLAENSLSSKVGKPVSVGMESVALDVEEPKKNPPPEALPKSSPLPQSVPSGGGAGSFAPPASGTSPELQKALEDIKDLKKEVESYRGQSPQAAGSTPPGPVSGNSWLSDLVRIGKEYPLGTAIALALIFFAALVLVFIPSRSLVSGFSQIRTAFDSLSKALKAIGDSLGRSSGNEASVKDNASDEKKDASPAPAEIPAAQVASAPKRELGMEELEEKIQTIRKSHLPEYDTMVVDLVLGYLHDDQKSYWAVFLLDMLGRENARRIFECLDPADQEELMRLVKHEVPEEKIEANLELVDAYQMRLLTFGWKGGGISRSLDADLQRTLGQVAFDDLPAIMQKLSENGIRRLLLYLEAKTVSHLIRVLARSPDSQRFLVGILAHMPEAIHDQALDKEILSAIQQHNQKKKDDIYLPYFTQYEEIVSHLGDELEDEIIDQLSLANPEVGAYLKRKLITMGTFFSLSSESQKSLLSGFTNGDFALFVSATADEGNKNVIFALLAESRQEMVTEQLSILAEEGKLQLAERHKEIRKRVRQLLKQAKANGGESEFADRESTSQITLGRPAA